MTNVNPGSRNRLVHSPAGLTIQKCQQLPSNPGTPKCGMKKTLRYSNMAIDHSRLFQDQFPKFPIKTFETISYPKVYRFFAAIVIGFSIATFGQRRKSHQRSDVLNPKVCPKKIQNKGPGLVLDLLMFISFGGYVCIICI